MPRSPKKSPTKKRPTTKKPVHPTYKEMITEAIMEDKKWTKGSSRQSIKKYITTNYGIEDTIVRQKLRTTLRRLTDEDDDPILIQPTVGCFKLNPEWKEEWKKKKEKKELKKTMSGTTQKKKRKTTTKKRKTPVRRKRDKNAPRRNYSAYIIFSNSIRETIRDKYPKLTFGDISKKIARKWRTLDDSKKDKFKALAEQDKKRYEKEFKAYKKKKKRSKRSSSTSSSTSTSTSSSSSSSSSSSEEDSKSSSTSSSSEKKKKKDENEKSEKEKNEKSEKEKNEKEKNEKSKTDLRKMETNEKKEKKSSSSSD